jgi:hypothetical protein
MSLHLVFIYKIHNLKGQCHEIFNIWFFRESVSPKPLNTIRAVLNFFENSRRYSQLKGTGVFDTGGKWKKSSIIKVFIVLFGHLWEVELTYRYIFAFKFTLRSQQPDIVPIICHRCQIASGIFDTGGKFATGINITSETGGKICHRCR